MQIEIATKEDFSQIRKLWELVFSEDSSKYLDFYFDIVMNKNKVLMVKDHGNIIGMLHLNPYIVKGLEVACYYIVGVATHPNYRRKGVMRELLAFARKIADETGHELILLPEDERYYKPFGFEFVSNQYNTTIHSKGYKALITKDKINSKQLSEDELLKWFEENKYKEKYLEAIHSQDYLKSLYREITCEGGRFINIEGNLVAYYLLDVLDIRRMYLVETEAGKTEAGKTEDRKTQDRETQDRETQDRETEDKVLRVIASKLLQIAGDKHIVIHEVNERKLSKVFPYSRRNNYDYRPYMMNLKKCNHKNTIYFDEVV